MSTRRRTKAVRERCPRRNFSRAFEQLAAEQRLEEAPSDVGDGRTVGCGSGEAQLPPGGSRPEKITPASSLEQRFEAVAAAEVEERALEVESAVRLQHSCELPGTDPACEPGARDDDDVDFVVGEWKLSVPLRREDADVSEAPPLDHPAETVVIGDPGPGDHLVTQLRNRREGQTVQGNQVRALFQARDEAGGSTSSLHRRSPSGSCRGPIAPQAPVRMPSRPAGAADARVQERTAPITFASATRRLSNVGVICSRFV